ncbi:uncharacterized protein BX663DRAFT_24640 [Cokeromyces recurvatus]|uniref:uncharacterized protein n=1 Tax=Cokeromyces recurvatus TaxID=90255 RepID=UPI00221F0A61|nr:uncharacterized protein BX663DRAFT_24640 [Cokeromyces recurvatus]KAI7908211.1 hypothetical protein BX663DRAFT_24640 [Cokeromyces recurvatus]
MSSLEPSSYSNDSHLATTTTTTTTTPLLMNDTSPSMMTCNSTPSNQLWYNSILFDENNNRFDYFSSLPFTEESLLSTTSHPYYDQKEEDVYHSTHNQDDFTATNDSYRYSHPTTITTNTYYSRDKMGHLNHDIYSWHEPSSTISHLDPSPPPPPPPTNEAVLMDTKWLDEFLYNIHTVSWPHILPSTIEPYKINNIYHDCATHFFPDNHFGYP